MCKTILKKSTTQCKWSIFWKAYPLTTPIQLNHLKKMYDKWKKKNSSAVVGMIQHIVY